MVAGLSSSGVAAIINAGYYPIPRDNLHAGEMLTSKSSNIFKDDHSEHQWPQDFQVIKQKESENCAFLAHSGTANFLKWIDYENVWTSLVFKMRLVKKAKNSMSPSCSPPCAVHMQTEKGPRAVFCDSWAQDEVARATQWNVYSSKWGVLAIGQGWGLANPPQ